MMKESKTHIEKKQTDSTKPVVYDYPPISNVAGDEARMGPMGFYPLGAKTKRIINYDQSGNITEVPFGTPAKAEFKPLPHAKTLITEAPYDGSDITFTERLDQEERTKTSIISPTPQRLQPKEEVFSLTQSKNSIFSTQNVRTGQGYTQRINNETDSKSNGIV